MKISLKKQSKGLAGKISAAGNGLISVVSGFMAAVLMIYGGYVLYDSFYTQNRAFSGKGMLQYKPEIIEDADIPLSGNGFISSINEDYRAWVTLDDTNIDYPVVQGENDLYYASHDINKDFSLTGSIYLAAASSSDFSDNYNILYGHHMDNGAMFGGLDNYKDEDYFNTYSIGTLVCGDTLYDLTVFAVVNTDAYEPIIYSTGNRDLADIAEYVRDNNIHLNDQEMDEADKILAFSTCASAETNGRLVVLASMKVYEKAAAAQDEIMPAGTQDITIPADGEKGSIIEITDNETVIIEDQETPLARITRAFKPTGSSLTGGSWALVDLVCAVLSVYLLIPFLHLKDKYSRSTLLNKYAEEKNSETRKYNRRFVLCVSLEAVLAAGAVILFILTEDMRTPMTLIDQWTPFHLLLLAGSAVLDKHLLRGSRKDLTRQADKLRLQAE